MYHPKRISGLCTAFLLVSNICSAHAATHAAQPSFQPLSQSYHLYLPSVSRMLPLLNDAVQSVDVAAAGSTITFHTPMDATPDPDGNLIYFTAKSPQGAGVFRVPADGGNAISLTVGSPISEPFGIAISHDGQTLFVADPSVVVSSTTTNTLTTRIAAQNELTARGVNRPNLAIPGEIFRIPAGGGQAIPVAGTGCTRPRGMSLLIEDGVEMIYFTGVDPTDDVPAIMKIPAVGGTLQVIEKGDGLVEPVGIAVDKSGRIYVTDQAAGDNGMGAVLRITPRLKGVRNDHRDWITRSIRSGDPAGVTLTLDESLLLVSSHQFSEGTSEVWVVNTSTLEQGVVNKEIGNNRASGGLHRAHKNNTFAWADLGADGSGTVYRVKLK